ncbi:MAG: hypothetical protein HWD85_09810 [Flavobacteriaceae bacterium]|nr:hypothetical protein [Flavobacteriaceae bacterium]
MTTELQAHWKYSEKEWNSFVTIEKANKKEDNIYFGIGIVILGTLGLMLFRSTSILVGLAFSVPFAILIPFLRMKISYGHLKKGIKNPEVKIYFDKLLINRHTIELQGKHKRVKSMKIIESKNKIQLLEFNVQWLTRKGPTNDEFRIPIPKGKINEANYLVSLL